MFFYLLHNSSLIKKQTSIDKHISTMIYGSLIYILLHALLYTSMDNKFFVSLRKYFWIIFVLDCISVSFTYIVNDNGKILFDKKLTFPEPSKLPNVPKNMLYKNIIKNNENENENKNNKNNENKNKNNGPKNIEKKLDKKINNEKDKIEDVEETTETLKKSTSIRDLRNEEIERLALSNIDKEISDGDSELGSDLDLDAFEKSLNTGFPK